MTTYTPFRPGPLTPFAFTPTLDGNQYTVIVTWNVFGARWFLSVYGPQLSLIVSLGLTASPSDYDVNLVAGYFSSSLVYRESTGNFEVSP